MIFTDIKNGRFYNEDCFDAMREIPDGVIDMVLCGFAIWDYSL